MACTTVVPKSVKNLKNQVEVSSNRDPNELGVYVCAASGDSDAILIANTSKIKKTEQVREITEEMKVLRQSYPGWLVLPKRYYDNFHDVRSDMMFWKNVPELEGLKPDEIAKFRNFTVGTIISHLARFIPTGEVSLSELVPSAHQEAILKVIQTIGKGESKTAIKNLCPPEVTYQEIELVLDALD